MIPILILSVLAVLIGPLCYHLGVRHGVLLQFRASRGLRPGTLSFKPEANETIEQDEPATQAQMQEMCEVLQELQPEQLRDRAEFYAVKYDDRPAQKPRIIQDIAKAHFFPGAYRA